MLQLRPLKVSHFVPYCQFLLGVPVGKSNVGGLSPAESSRGRGKMMGWNRREAISNVHRNRGAMKLSKMDPTAFVEVGIWGTVP